MCRMGQRRPPCALQARSKGLFWASGPLIPIIAQLSLVERFRRPGRRSCPANRLLRMAQERGLGGVNDT